jgi:UDP-N-acetylmuramoylalanine--D-glutamate ligase
MVEIFDYKNYFKGKRVTLLGLGLLGRGVGDAKFLAKYCKELTVTDLKTEKELQPSIKELSGFKNIKFVLEHHDLSDFKNTDMVIKGAGVPLDSPFVKEAFKNKVSVHMSTAIFAKFFTKQFGGTVIGITGTRGKSTVTHLVYHILKESGENVEIGGNVQGISTLAMIESIKPKSTIVLELDSWQLQGFGYEKIGPQISVFTTLFPDHMNYYKNDMGKYLADKANIFLYQSKKDVAIIGEQAYPAISKSYKSKIKSKILKATAKNIPSNWKLPLPGEHNKANIICAIEAAIAAGISLEDIKKGVESFKGVAGRLEFVGAKNGIKIYNDTTSTTPEATVAGLKALHTDGNKNIVLICGGADKNLDMQAFIKEAKIRAKNTILLAGSGTDRIKENFDDTTVYKSLAEAVKEAFIVARKGDTILFSPAFASFGMFSNEYERGDKFNKIIKDYLK